jgi:hypothetical protein
MKHRMAIPHWQRRTLAKVISAWRTATHKSASARDEELWKASALPPSKSPS